eukprot:4566716-Alexandrium_andersonii.AAC.1
MSAYRGQQTRSGRNVHSCSCRARDAFVPRGCAGRQLFQTYAGGYGRTAACRAARSQGRA